MAKHDRITHFLGRPISKVLKREERKALEAEIERAIAFLDAFDGDCDLEEEQDMCMAGDDGCGATVRHGVKFWGADQDEMGTTPIYGVDQTKGPINEAEAVREHHRKLLAA